MNFDLTDDHLALRDAVRRFCDAEYPAHTRGNAEDAATAARRAKGQADLGLTGLAIDGEFGGSGLGAVEAMLVAEQLGRALAHGPWLASAAVGAPLLAATGSPAPCSAWLPAVASGELSLALAGAAHTPPGVTAVRDGSHWRLEGQAPLVPGADAAGVLLVAASTGEGATLFAVDASTPGLARHAVALIDGRGAAHLAFDGVRVAPDRVLGAPGTAQPLLDAAADRAEALLCADAAGALDALLAITVEHLKTRRQFGKPLASFQALQHRLADLAIALEQIRSMACVAAMAVDAGDAAQRARLVSAAKAFVAPLARRCAFEAIQFHGAMGMTDECRVGHHAKRLIADAMLFGDAPSHLRRFASTSPTPEGDTR